MVVPENPMVGSFPGCCAARRQRPRCRRAAEQRHEFPPPHAEHGGSLPRVPPPIIAGRNRRAQAVCRIWSLLAVGKRVLRADLNCSERGSRFGGAARRYAEIASAAPHARHMPSHISRASVIGKTRSGSNLAAVGSAIVRPCLCISIAVYL